jgi:ABC-type dipeptide/oligopeptide/nickel transport system permease subunit
MQRIQSRLRLGYGLVFGGGIALAAAMAAARLTDWVLSFPWSLLWLVLAIIPSAGIALIFLTAVEERDPQTPGENR